MEIKKTNLKVTDRMELNPIDVNSINEPKKLLGMTPKFKTMYFDFFIFTTFLNYKLIWSPKTHDFINGPFLDALPPEACSGSQPCQPVQVARF